MASLTPLSKGLIALAVVGAMASAAWHLGLKEKLGDAPVLRSPPSVAAGTQTPSTVTAPADEPGAAPGMTLPASPGMAVTAPEPEQPVPRNTPEPAPTPAPAPERQTPSAGMSPAEHAELGRKLLESQDFQKARVQLEQAVQGGDGGAACHLGEMHLKGQGGLPVNRDKAASLFQLAQSRNTICFASGQ